ncbi:MAG: heavy metal translocating P-type ATPase, partial [Methanobacteriota archaeon]
MENKTNTSEIDAEASHFQKVNLKITGMHCAGCVATVENALKKQPGVKEVGVNLATNKAHIIYDPEVVTREKLEEAVEKSGYGVEDRQEKIVLNIMGMHCAGCVNAVERALTKTNGVVEAVVNLATNKAHVTILPDEVSPGELIEAVRKAGYDASLQEEVKPREMEVDEEEQKWREARKRMWIAWALTIPAMVWMIPEMFYGIMFPSPFIFNIGLTLLAIPVLFYPGLETMRSAWRSVSHGSANMDVLIALGTLASVSTGILGLVLPMANFAGIAGMIMSIHLTGRYIESRARGKASQALRKLLELGAKTARLIRNGVEEEVPVEEIQVG